MTFKEYEEKTGKEAEWYWKNSYTEISNMVDRNDEMGIIDYITEREEYGGANMKSRCEGILSNLIGNHRDRDVVYSLLLEIYWSFKKAISELQGMEDTMYNEEEE